LLDDTKSFVTKQGSIYVATSAKTSQQFVAFLNSMYRMKEALYPGGVANPSFPFTLKQLPSNVDVQLKIGNEAPMTGPGAQKRFVWSGGEEVQVLSKSGDMLENYSGAWGVFKFIARANQKESGRLEWSKQTNGVTDKLPNGKDWSYDYQLQVTTATNPFFELPGMKCVSKVAAGP